jgi:hypothetical protein
MLPDAGRKKGSSGSTKGWPLDQIPNEKINRRKAWIVSRTSALRQQLTKAGLEYIFCFVKARRGHLGKFAASKKVAPSCENRQERLFPA